MKKLLLCIALICGILSVPLECMAYDSVTGWSIQTSTSGANSGFGAKTAMTKDGDMWVYPITAASGNIWFKLYYGSEAKAIGNQYAQEGVWTVGFNGDYKDANFWGLVSGTSYEIQVRLTDGNAKVQARIVKSSAKFRLIGNNDDFEESVDWQYASTSVTFKQDAVNKNLYTTTITPKNTSNFKFKVSRMADEYLTNGQTAAVGEWTGWGWNTGGEGNEIEFTGAAAGVSYTVELEVNDAFSPSSMRLRVTPVVIVDDSEVHMPLKRSDFSSGSKYFLVGTRMADWRLQPEWQYISKEGLGSNQLGLRKARVMYTGLIGVAKVDSYEDYVAQTYTLYKCNGTEVKKGGSTILTGLDSWPGFQAPYDYDWTNLTCEGNRPGSNVTIKFLADRSDYSDDSVLGSHGVVMDDVILTLDNAGVPVSLDFRYSDEPITDYITFSLVGSGILPAHGVDGDGNPLDVNGKSPRGKSEWQEAWIQYDNEGRPYVDGHGNTLYQTVFQPTWFQNHPSRFVENGNEDFMFSSRGLMLINTRRMQSDDPDGYANDPYRPIYERFKNATDKTIGSENENKQVVLDEKFAFDEALISHYKDNGNLKDDKVSRTANWECFVAKDVWLSGEFKIWTGWGGGSIWNEGNSVGDDAKVLARWYNLNGGHGAENDTYTIEKANLLSGSGKTATSYATFSDVYGANFQTADGKRQYFKRVIIWYDPDNGFDKSVIQFVSESYAPVIEASRMAGNKGLTYRWQIPVDQVDNNDESRKVESYIITRYRVRPDGTEELSGYVEGDINNPVRPENLTLGDLKGVWKDGINDLGLPAGVYRYGLLIKIEGGITRDVRSNPVSLINVDVPVVISAVQMSEGTTPENRKLTFDMEVEIRLSDAAMSAINSLGQNTTDVVRGYILKLERELSAGTLNRSTIDGLTDEEAAKRFVKGDGTNSFRELYDTDGQLQNVNGYFMDLALGKSASNGFARKLIFHNVLKEESDPSFQLQGYTFTVYLKRGDDVDRFLEGHFGVDERTVKIIVPATTVKIDPVRLYTVDYDGTYGDAAPAGTENSPVGNYSGINYLGAAYTLTEPKLTRATMESYSPTYMLNIGGKETEVTALSGRMRYLPVPVVAGDTESAITVEARVKYNRNNKSAYSEKDAEAVSYSFETLPAPSISVDKELIGKQFPETPDKHWRFDAVMKLNLGLPENIEPFAVAGYSIEKDLGVSEDCGHHVAHKGCADHDYHGFVLDDAVAGFGYTSGEDNWCELGIEKGYIPVYVEALDYKNADWVYTQGIDLNLIPTVHVYYPFFVAANAADRVYPDQAAPAPAVSRVAMALPEAGRTVLYERPSTLPVSFRDAATTGITDIYGGVDDSAEYFDMQGRRVANPAPGIYIVRRGSDVRREIVR